MKTTFPKIEEVQRSWYIVDATGKPAGRLAAEVAKVLRGKHKPLFTPHVDVGDFVVIINAEKVILTGNKDQKKLYSHYTGYPSGLRSFTAATIREKNPTRILLSAIKGMTPKNNAGRKIFKRVKVYAGSDHPHGAQQPTPLDI